MALFVSTNMYGLGKLKNLKNFVNIYGDKVGFEIFPLFHKEGYEDELKMQIFSLQKTAVSFHGPYYCAEHSAPKGSEEYEKTMDMVKTTLEYCKLLNSRYVVFHHNNCKVKDDKKAEMIKISCDNYRDINEMFAPYNIPVVVENAGVIDRGNMLLDQNQFIELCKKEGYKVLIDIGHANANGWDLYYVMEMLREQIVAYHLHNNDGVHDSHLRIHNGTIDFEKFMRDALTLTPSAEFILEYCMETADDIEGIKTDIEEILAKLK